MSVKDEADSNGDADIAKVEAVLRKAHGFMNAVCNGLYNAVSGVRDDPHVQRHSGTDAGQGNAEEQEDQLQPQIIFRRGNPCGEQIHKAGKDKAQGQL